MSWIPAAAQVDFSAPIQGSAAGEQATVEVRRLPGADSTRLEVEIRFRMMPDVHVYRAESLFLKIDDIASRGLGSPVVTMPEPVRYTNFDSSVVDVMVDGHTIRVSRSIDSTAWVLDGYIQFQACNKSTCFMPQKKRFRFTSMPGDSEGVVEFEGGASFAATGGWEDLVGQFSVVGRVAGYLDARAFGSFLDDPAGHGSTNALAGKGLALVILLVLVGGLALNLTPCVLPMVPITIAVIGAGAQAGSRRRGFGLGGVYGLGMALAYGALGLAVVLTGTQFGVINSSPIFNLAVAGIFVLLALGMFDVIHIDFTRFRSGVRAGGQRRGSVPVVFAMGVLAAILAGACVAPVLISVILYSSSLYAKGQFVGLLLPFLLGVGMALPWPFAGAGLSFLPKPGKWMSWVRNSFGVVILAIALWYAWEGVRPLVQGRAAQSVEPASAESADRWTSSLEDGLRASQQSGKPVLVDFWATWCKNCLAMDATTMRDSAVIARLDSYVLVKYRAESPSEAQTKKVLDHFGVVGLPTYVVLRPVPASGLVAP